jgi:hypothetical protein
MKEKQLQIGQMFKTSRSPKTIRNFLQRFYHKIANQERQLISIFPSKQLKIKYSTKSRAGQIFAYFSEESRKFFIINTYIII